MYNGFINIPIKHDVPGAVYCAPAQLSDQVTNLFLMSSAWFIGWKLAAAARLGQCGPDNAVMRAGAIQGSRHGPGHCLITTLDSREGGRNPELIPWSCSSPFTWATHYLVKREALTVISSKPEIKLFGVERHIVFLQLPDSIWESNQDFYFEAIRSVASGSLKPC